MSEKITRATVVELARRWINTPYHHMGRIRGSGVDCAMMPLEVYLEAGLICNPPEIPFYPLDWALHRNEEKYLDLVSSVVADAGGVEVGGPLTRIPLPGDFLLFHFGRTYSHGAIVVDWPLCIHAHIRCGVVYVDMISEPKLAAKINTGDCKCFTFWESNNVR